MTLARQLEFDLYPENTKGVCKNLDLAIPQSEDDVMSIINSDDIETLKEHVGELTGREGVWG